MNGIRAYIPPEVLAEIRAIQTEGKLKNKADALRKMANYSNKARTVSKIFNFDF